MSTVSILSNSNRVLWENAARELDCQICSAPNAHRDVTVIDLTDDSQVTLSGLFSSSQIIALTDLNHLAASVEAYSVGVMDFVFMPTTYSKVKSCLSRALRRSQPPSEHQSPTGGNHSDEFWKRVATGRVNPEMSAILDAAKRMGLCASMPLQPFYLFVGSWPHSLPFKRHDATNFIHCMATEYLLGGFTDGCIVELGGDDMLIISYLQNSRLQNEFSDKLKSMTLAISAQLGVTAAAYMGSPCRADGLFAQKTLLEELTRGYAIASQPLVAANSPKLTEYQPPVNLPDWQILLENGDYSRLLSSIEVYLRKTTADVLVSTEWLTRFYQDVSQLIYALLMNNGIPISRLLNNKHLLQSMDKARKSVDECMEALTSMTEETRLLLLECGSDDSIIGGAVRYINANLSKNIARDELAASLYVSPGYLSRVFRRELGQSLSEYITAQRLSRSFALLSGTSLTAAEIAARVGYSGSSQFCSAFKELTGMTPMSYRKTHRKV